MQTKFLSPQNVKNKDAFFDTSGSIARDGRLKNKVSDTIDDIGLGRA